MENLPYFYRYLLQNNFRKIEVVGKKTFLLSLTKSKEYFSILTISEKEKKKRSCPHLLVRTWEAGLNDNHDVTCPRNNRQEFFTHRGKKNFLSSAGTLVFFADFLHGVYRVLRCILRTCSAAKFKSLG